MEPDILTLLPPDTVITGFVGDGMCYHPFRTTAGTARTDIAETCAAHAAHYAAHFENGRVHQPTSFTSYWFYDREGETKAEISEFPGLTLYIGTVVTFGKWQDIRTDPWVVNRIAYEAPDFVSWDPNPDTLRKAAEHFRKLTEFCAKLAGSQS